MMRRPSRLSVELVRVMDELADALWPPRCRLCGAHAEDAIACGEHALPHGPPGERCGRCLAPLPAGVPGGARCASCRRSPPGWKRLVALGDYRAQPALREWVLAFKHGGRVDLARPLAQALGQVALEEGALAEGALVEGALVEDKALLVPVPLHPRRRLERGYDQAARLAAELEAQLGLRALRALRRARDTPPQGEPGARSRAANVHEAFAPRLHSAARVRGRAVWLVDDVVTSGATVAECARALRSLGAVEVSVLALARAASGGRLEPDAGVG